MKPNQTIYLDLFSILATGIFVIMNTVTGPDNPSTSARPNYTIVRAFFGVSDTLSKLPGNPVFVDLVRLEPFFVVGGKEVDRADLSGPIDIASTIEGMQIMIRGDLGKAAIGFRIAEIVDRRSLGETGEFKIQIVGKSDAIEGVYQIGYWSDPIIELNG